MANNIAIDTTHIQSMVERLRSVASRAQMGSDGMSDVVGQLRQSTSKLNEVSDPFKSSSVDAVNAVSDTEDIGQVEQTAQPVDFAQVLKSTLDQVNDLQGNAKKMSQDFAMGDDSVNLSDVMIAMQKSSIAFQTSVQVRNKLVSAYRDIMTMQV